MEEKDRDGIGEKGIEKAHDPGVHQLFFLKFVYENKKATWINGQTRVMY